VEERLEAREYTEERRFEGIDAALKGGEVFH